MSISMYIRCKSCNCNFHLTTAETIRCKDLPDTCGSCWMEEVYEEVREKEIAMSFRKATQHDNWYWEGDTIGYDTYGDDEDTAPHLPLLAASNPPHVSEPLPAPPEVLPPQLQEQLDRLVAALLSNWGSRY